MKLHIENFGPIQKGEIDLTKRFYTFVGYNNSGKTYMSQLLWILNSMFHKEQKPITLKDIKNNTFEISESYINESLKYYQQNFANYQILDSLKVSETNTLVEKASFNFSRNNLKTWEKKEVLGVLVFNQKKSIIFRKKANQSNIELEINNSISELINAIPNPIRSQFESSRATLEDIDLSWVIQGMLMRGLGIMTFVTFFLPANRDFFPTFYKEIYQGLQNERDFIIRQYNSSPNLVKIQDLLKPNSTKAIDELTQKILQDKYIETNHYTDLVADLEEIMGGKITTRQAEGIAPVEFQFEMNDAEKSKLDLYLASSSVNQLTTLYLYLKYWASKSNNFLFIDEPEENLHPSNQIKLVNLLMKFANRNNNRVLVSTHSSFVAEMINNYAQIAYLQEEGKDIKEIIDKNKLDIQPIENLKHQDFGVYFFNGETIREYEVKEHGAFFEDFHKEQRKVQDISYLLNDAIYKILDPEE